MRPFASIVAAALAAACLTLPAAAQDKPVQFRFAHWVPTSHPVHAAAEMWAESVRKASGGTITTTIYPAQQLGKAFDHYNMARDGIADVAYVNPGYEPGRFPIMGASELPFIFANAKEGSAALDAWYRKYAAAEMKDVHYCLTFSPRMSAGSSTFLWVVCTVPGSCRKARQKCTSFISCAAYLRYQASKAAVPASELPNTKGSSDAPTTGNRPGSYPGPT